MTSLVDLVCEAAHEKKGEDLIAIDVGQRTILAEHFVIVSGRSHVQTRAIADAIIEQLRASGTHSVRVEGYNDASWILLDCGTVVVHIFTPEQRAFYNLERLWGSGVDHLAATAS